jgi:gliding motility-associated-like protein
MKRKAIQYFTVALVLLWSISLSKAFAQTPEWSVDPAQYSNSMAVVGIIIIDRVESVDDQDRIAAFINGECRGMAPLLFDENVNRYLAYLLVYANETNAQVNFKVYDASNDAVYDVPYQINFVVNGLVGEIERPYLWSDIELNKEASITDFSIQGQVGETQIVGEQITVKMPLGTDLTSLTANFTLSPGASTWINGTRQRSGSMSNDFSETLVYHVESEDRQTQKSYTVEVQLVEPPITSSEGIPLNAVNAITPNGDGVNDNWIIRNLEIFDGYKLSIFDSSGRLLYQTMNYQNEWEGTYQGNPLGEGIYYYLFSKGADTRKGIISIIK